MLNISRILKFVLIAEAIALLGIALVLSRDYQDSWILAGLEIPFAVFMITYLIYVFSESTMKWIVTFALICRSVILLIPNLKYVWFYGMAIDQNVHYSLIQETLIKGYVPSGMLYSETPLMQIFFVMYSKITNVSVLYVFKYLPIFSGLLYPLVTFIVMKKIFSIKKNPSVIKYAVFISSIPVPATISYVVVGTLMGALLFFLFLSQLIRLSQTRDRRYWLTTIVFGLALVSAHTYSSIILAAGLSIAYLANKIFKVFQTHTLSIHLLTFLIVLNAVWLSWLISSATILGRSFERIIVTYINAMKGITVIGWSPTGVRTRFFELNFIDKLKIAAVFHGYDIFVLLLTLCGIIVVVKKLHLSKSLTFLSLFVLSLWSFYPAQIMLTGMRAGLVEYNRIIEHTIILSPIFVSIFFYYVRKKMRTSYKKILAFLSLSLIALATVELYDCQPLVPPSSAISKDLPSNEPLDYIGMVNSAYQRFMINHAEEYIGEGMLIACDHTTESQTIGFTNYDFSSHHIIGYYPYSKLLDKRIPELKYDFFLIHLPGKSGAFGEKAEIRTRTLILEAIYNSSVVYTNGESCILSYPFFYESNEY